MPQIVDRLPIKEWNAWRLWFGSGCWSRWAIGWASCGLVGLLIGQPHVGYAAKPSPAASSTGAAPSPIHLVQCPSQLDGLTALMLRDLPSYANRVSQRSFDQLTGRPGYVLIAGKPDFAPLTLGPGSYTPTNSSTPDQIFFTTLERQYVDGKSVSLQHYHWLFLTPTDRGWQFVMMLSSLGDYPTTHPPTPPEDTSQGVIAQAVRLWLRDCEMGRLYQ